MLEKGKLAQAETTYRAILAQDPSNANALHKLGVILTRRKNPAAAVEFLQRAVALRPRTAAAHASLGNTLRALKQHEEAVASYERALALKPDSVAVLNNRGATLRILRRYEEALASYERALALEPGDAGLHNNRGNVLLALRRHEEALASYQRALALKPDHAGAHWNEGLCRLLLGDLSQGWRKYEWRWQRPTFSSLKRDFTPPLWLGDQSLQGRIILLHAEQGLGDTIQFSRYAERVAALGATVLLEVQPPLQSLLASLKGPAQVLAKGEPLPAFDYHCPLLSLPLAFDTRADTIPADIPYVRAPAERIAHWEIRLGPRSKPRVGIVWSGQPKHRNDRNRSLAFRALAPILQQDIQIVSLQKEVRERDRALLDRHDKVMNFGEELADFADTAGLVAALDLVIAVDTSVAHLAGALGRPLWLLLPHTPDWRWLLNRADSPWYPTARLFRQPSVGDWASVVQDVAGELRASTAKASGMRLLPP